MRTLSLTDFTAEIQDTIRNTGIEDLHPAEIHAFFSGLRSSYGLAALRMAKHQQRSVTSFHSQEGIDFAEAPRHILLNGITACTGLPKATCHAALQHIEEILKRETQPGQPLTITEWGTLTPRNSGFILTLQPQIAIIYPERP